MIAAAALSFVVMAHHPTGVGHGGLAQGVHGAMIAVVGVLFFGFAHFSLKRGLKPLVLAGLVAYGLGVGANVAAATINGFVAPALAAKTETHDLFLLLWETNQAFAGLGVATTGAAFVLWSSHLLISGPARNRLFGLVGLAAGVAPVAALAASVLEMNVAGAFVIYSVHAAFAALVGLQLLRGKF
jgi:hypothetical protein